MKKVYGEGDGVWKGGWRRCNVKDKRLSSLEISDDGGSRLQLERNLLIKKGTISSNNLQQRVFSIKYLYNFIHFGAKTAYSIPYERVLQTTDNSKHTWRLASDTRGTIEPYGGKSIGLGQRGAGDGWVKVVQIIVY